MSSNHEGRCSCGRILLCLSGEPEAVVYCHCEDCRRWSGAPVTVFVGYQRDRVKTIGDEPKVYDSSPGVKRALCGSCGTSLSYEDELLSGEIYFSVGILDDPEAFEPRAHSWHSRKLGWMDLHDDLPRHEESSRPR